MAQKVCNYTLPDDTYEAIKWLSEVSSYGQSEIVRMILVPAVAAALVKSKQGLPPLADHSRAFMEFQWSQRSQRESVQVPQNLRRMSNGPKSPPTLTPTPTPLSGSLRDDHPTPRATPAEHTPTMFSDASRKRGGVTDLDPPGRLPHGIRQVGLDGPDGPKRYCNLSGVLQAFTVTREQIIPFLIPEDDIRIHAKEEWVRSAGVHAAANLSLDPEAGIIKAWWDSVAMKV